MNKRRIIIAVLLILLVGLLIGAWYYFTQMYSLHITAQHVSHVDVYDGSKQVGSLPGSGTVRVTVGKSYTVKYTGEGVYASGSQAVPDGATTVTIDPYYSDSKLAAMFSGESAAIHQVLEITYPKLPTLYRYSQERLYHFGEWYGVALEYTGGDIFNNDTLKAVLHKDNDTWKLACQPAPSLNIYSCPTAPLDVLMSTNNVLK